MEQTQKTIEHLHALREGRTKASVFYVSNLQPDAVFPVHGLTAPMLPVSVPEPHRGAVSAVSHEDMRGAMEEEYS